ncbi:dihydrodipicolinate synthase family protein [Pseudomonas sp. MWU15-20650]|uniref:dihydrodipicolinate synthase family protein n=1 Tax=Pseudomonas sp. MWU15-20650 TaxID=2933107 RepID=UPI0020107112|nr:dihydrodipicolinate synthase family protein [Pseudomonas sp. MWU15-20650]
MSKHHVLVPIVTPLDSNGNVCRQSVKRLMHACKPLVDGFIPCLTSGEGWNLSCQQWTDMLRYTLEFADEAHRVVVGIERPTTREVMERAELAHTMGAKEIMLTSPFGDGVTQQQILEHYQAVHDSSPLDLMVYNEAALSGNEKSFETLLDIARMERVTGLKDSPSQARTQAQINMIRQEGVDYFIGWEHQLAGDLVSDGNVVSLANLEPALCRVACRARQPEIADLVSRLNEKFSLGEDDWYAHVKRELVARGMLSSAVTTQERAQ